MIFTVINTSIANLVLYLYKANPNTNTNTNININISLADMVLYLHKADPNSNPANAADVARDLLREDGEAAFSVDLHRSLCKRIWTFGGGSFEAFQE